MEPHVPFDAVAELMADVKDLIQPGEQVGAAMAVSVTRLPRSWAG